MKSAGRAVAPLALAAAMVGFAAAAVAQTAQPPRQGRMTWFGITNWHYQIRDLGIMLDRAVAFFVSNSGAGAEIMKDRIDDGVNRGSPIGNLFKAARDAGITSFDVWQAGPETSLVAQARIVVPAFVPKYFIPHHMGNRGGY